ncbi:hypothetical protein GQY15_00105 [Rhodobacter sphaeroides]|nr:hypothetical protein [Cereibacter sphaeroides]
MSSDASCQREHPRPAARGYSASRRDVPERRFRRAPCGERASAQGRKLRMVRLGMCDQQQPLPVHHIAPGMHRGRPDAPDSANGLQRPRRSLPVQAHRDPAWQHPLDLIWVAAESAPPTAHRCS